jgi:hypothetical protein
MNVAEHIANAQRLHRSTAKLDLVDDFEMVLEGAMLAAAQLINAMLHATGETAPRAEMLHTDMRARGVPERPDSEAARQAWDLLAQLEWYRPLHVRGSVPHTRQVAEECWAAYLAAIHGERRSGGRAPRSTAEQGRG